jgi:hypothetical protein
LELFDGMLQGAATHFRFNDDPTRVSIEDEMKYAFLVEYGIKPDKLDGKLEVMGVYSFERDGDRYMGGDDMDVVFLGHTKDNFSKFTSDLWKIDAIPNKWTGELGHERLFALNYNEIEELRTTGIYRGKKKDIIFSTRALLDSIVDSDFD